MEIVTCRLPNEGTPIKTAGCFLTSFRQSHLKVKVLGLSGLVNSRLKWPIKVT